MLGLRSRIEFLEKYFWPIDAPNSKTKSRKEKWMDILTSKHNAFTNSTEIMEFRKQVFEQYKLSDKDFVKNIVLLYGECSSSAAHKINVPPSISKSTVREALELMGVAKIKYILETAEIIVTPLESIEPPLNQPDESDH